MEKVYFDSVNGSLVFSGIVFSFGAVPVEEKLVRLQKATAFYADKSITLQEKLDKEKAKNKKKAKEVKELKKSLAEAESKKGLKGIFR